MKKLFLAIFFSIFAYANTAYAQFSLPGGGAGLPSGRGGQVQRGVNDSRLGLSSLFGTGGLLSGNWTIWDIIYIVIYLLLTFAGIVAVFFIILGGYYYMTAGGSDQSKKGKETLVNAVIGLIIVILSYLIVQVVINTFSGGLFGTGIL